VRECRVRYEAAARYDDVVQIARWIIHLDRLWLKFGFTIRDEQDQLIIEGQTDHGCTNNDQRPKRMPRALFNLLSTFAPERGD